MDLRLRNIFLMSLLGNIFFLVLIYSFFPDIGGTLIEEDYIIENISAGLFLFAAGAALFLIMTGKYHINKALLLLTAGLGFLFFLEEVGFGGRFFGIPMPEIGGGEVDGFHDIFSAAYLKSQGLPTIFLILTTLLIVAVVITVVLKWKEELKALHQYIWQINLLFFISVCILLILFATVLDMGFLDFYLLELIEEVLEMNAGLALCFGAISATEPSRATVRL